VNKPSWKSVVFDELHLIREKMTKEITKSKLKKKWKNLKKERLRN